MSDLKQTYHEEDGLIHIHTYQDVEPHIEYAKARRREDAEKRGAFGKRPDFHHTMSVPFNVIEMAAKRLNIQPGDIFQSDNMKLIVKELKRPEFKLFRTTCDKKI